MSKNKKSKNSARKKRLGNNIKIDSARLKKKKADEKKPELIKEKREMTDRFLNGLCEITEKMKSKSEGFFFENRSFLFNFVLEKIGLPKFDYSEKEIVHNPVFADLNSLFEIEYDLNRNIFYLINNPTKDALMRIRNLKNNLCDKIKELEKKPEFKQIENTSLSTEEIYGTLYKEMPAMKFYNLIELDFDAHRMYFLFYQGYKTSTIGKKENLTTEEKEITGIMKDKLETLIDKMISVSKKLHQERFGNCDNLGINIVKDKSTANLKISRRMSEHFFLNYEINPGEIKNALDEFDNFPFLERITDYFFSFLSVFHRSKILADSEVYGDLLDDFLKIVEENLDDKRLKIFQYQMRILPDENPNLFLKFNNFSYANFSFLKDKSIIIPSLKGLKEIRKRIETIVGDEKNYQYVSKLIDLLMQNLDGTKRDECCFLDEIIEIIDISKNYDISGFKQYTLKQAKNRKYLKDIMNVAIVFPSSLKSFNNPEFRKMDKHKIISFLERSILTYTDGVDLRDSISESS